MPLFEIAVLREYKEDKKTKEELVIPPACVVAKDDKAAGLSFIVEHSHVLGGLDPDEIRIIVRPFG